MALAPDGIIVMHKALHPSSFIPAGFAMVAASSEGDRTAITVHSISRSSCCSTCGIDSHRVHSRYQRRIADLPLAEIGVPDRRSLPFPMPRRSVGRGSLLSSSPLGYWRLGRGVRGVSTSSYIISGWH